MNEARTLERRIRIALAFFIAGLVVSGVTAFPLETEIRWLTALLGADASARPADYTGVMSWLLTVRDGLVATNRAYPFLAYGTDWLAFAHLVIAAAFWGPFRDPVRNVWVIEWGMIACAAVIPLALIAGPVRDIPAYWRVVDSSFGVVGIGLFYAAYFQAVRHGGAALAAVLLYTAPVWVAVLAWLLRWERMTAGKGAALALTLAGVAGLASAAGGEVRVGVAALFWGLLAGWAYATYYLFGKRFFDRYPAPTLFLYALPVGALGLLPLVDFHPAKSAAAWGTIAFVALVPTYGAYLLYSAGLRRVEATRAATVATVEPVVSAAAAYLVWGERMAPAGYAFAALVLAGVVLMVRAGDARAE